VKAVIKDALLAQRGALVCWVPIALALGIGWYFAQSQEPTRLVWAILGVTSVACALLLRRLDVAYWPLVIAAILVIAGASAAKIRNDMVAAPQLTFRYYGPVQGRVVNIDRSASDALRLTLDHVVLDRIAPDRTPARVRVSLHGEQPAGPFRPGDVLILTGHLSPPTGPAEPGGFDFQRHAWFLKLGALGYTRNPVLRLEIPAQPDLRMRIFATRMAISAAVQAAIPGSSGAFATAIITGDRSAIDQSVLDDLRASNLAHLLAISGLHMGLLTGFVFGIFRYGLALVPVLALRWNSKKIAAVAALMAGAVYLAMSGGNVATERAFIMVAVMLVAILLNRRALTMRAVAIAAMIVLVWQPEALAGPGFQMSFAATVALIAVFSALRHFDLKAVPCWGHAVGSVFVSSLVAGLATAPFAAAHFNQISHYGLIANLVSVPLMGILVMPAAVLAACLAPLGLEGIGFGLMDFGLRWILAVAQVVAAWPGALSHVPAPQDAVLPVLAMGLLWLILWRGRARWAGIVVALAAFGLWHASDRPMLLVADDGGLIGLIGPQGRALSKPRGGSFVAGIWLENDGAPALQDRAATRPGLRADDTGITAQLGDWQILHVSGKTALARLGGCGGADLLVTNQIDARPRPCLVYDLTRLRQTGALALDLTPQGALRITSASAHAGNRPWNRRNGAPDQPVVIMRQ
jgi:competence protein ComEC